MVQMMNIYAPFKIRWWVHLPIFFTLLLGTVCGMFSFFVRGGILEVDGVLAFKVITATACLIGLHFLWMVGLTFRILVVERWWQAFFSFLITLAEYGLYKFVEFMWALSMAA
jgi:hypothetical protein